MAGKKGKAERLMARPPKIATAELEKLMAERHASEYWEGLFESQPRVRQQVLDHIRVERQIEKAAHRLDELELADRDTELGESDGGNECILALQQLLKNLRSTQLAKERVLAPLFRSAGSAAAAGPDPLAFLSESTSEASGGPPSAGAPEEGWEGYQGEGGEEGG